MANYGSDVSTVHTALSCMHVNYTYIHVHVMSVMSVHMYDVNV